MWPSRRGAKYTIWGKVVASLESGPWWVLWIQGRPWLVLAPRVLQHGINQLVGWFDAGSCKWINCLSFFLVPSRSSSTPLYPLKCWDPRSVPWAPNLSIIFYVRLIFESSKVLGSVSNIVNKLCENHIYDNYNTTKINEAFIIIILQLFYYNYIGYLFNCPIGSKGDTRSHKCYFTLVLHVFFPKNDFFIRMNFWMICFLQLVIKMIKLPQ